MTSALGGQPPKYNNLKDLQIAIKNYFDECDKTIIIKQHVTGKGIIGVPTPRPYSMAGLARAFGMSRETLNQYKKDDRFSDTISCARDRIHEQNISLGLIGCHDSRISALNLASNFGYATVTKSEISGPDGGPIELTNMERAAKLAALQKLAEDRKAKER